MIQRTLAYLRSFRVLWDAGLVAMLLLVVSAGCSNLHDDRAAEARENAAELRELADQADADLERETLLEEAKEWDARAEREEDAAHLKRTEESDRWLELAGAAVGLALGGYGVHRTSSKRAAKLVNEERDRRRTERGERV